MQTRFASVLVPVASVSAALLIVAACDSDGESGGGGTFDASTPGFDASQPPVVDASAPDVDAGPPVVTVRVRDRGNQPIAGASVVFGSASGEVLQTLQTDATGTAALLVPSGSQVTVVLGTESRPRLLTITAVEPGDDLVAADIDRVDDAVQPQVSVETTPDGGAGVGYYYARTGGCYGYQVPGTYALSARCVGRGAKFPVTVDGYDQNGAVAGSQFAKGLTLPTDGGTVTPTLGPWTAASKQTLEVDNIGDAGYAYAAYGEIADGVITASSAFLQAPNDGGTLSAATFGGRTGFPDAVQAEAFTSEYTPGGRIIVGSAVRKAAPAGDAKTTIDFATRLPAITASSLDAGAPSRPFVTWSAASSLASVDGTFVVLRWSKNLDGGTAVGTWTIVTPPAATSIQAPALPATLKNVPDVDALYQAPARIISIEASFANGYGDVRKAGGVLLPTTALIDNNGNGLVPPIPVNGTVKFTAFTVDGD